MKRQSSSLAIVTTTVASKTAARKMAGVILKSRLAACVQSFPIHSMYRWKGKIESTPEYLVQAKTRAALTAPLMARIKRQHAYEVPEIIVTPVTAAYGKYREWIGKETDTISLISHRTHRKTRK